MRQDVPRFQGVDDFPAAEGPETLDGENALPNGAEWQRVDRITLMAFKRRWFGLLKRIPVHRVLDNPLNEYRPDRFVYSSPHCCKDDFIKKLSDGYDELHSVSFPDMKILAMSRLERNGELSLVGLPGRWRPGQPIPGSLFAQRFAGIGEPVPSEQGVVDLKGFGPARRLLDLPPDLAPRIKQVHKCGLIEHLLIIDPCCQVRDQVSG